jgi:hypothetical protein
MLPALCCADFLRRACWLDGGCQNDTLFYSLPASGTSKCSPTPIAGGPTCGVNGLPAVSFKGGFEQPVAPHFVPPWYNWAVSFNQDGSAGPDGGMLPESDSCDFAFHSNRMGGSDSKDAQWQIVPYPGM